MMTAMEGQDRARLDPEVLERLRRLGGDVLMDRMIDLFLENAERRLQPLTMAPGPEEMEMVTRAAHSLKSSAGNVGATRLQHLFGELEDRAGAGDAARAGHLLAQINEAFSGLAAQLRADRNEQGS